MNLSSKLSQTAEQSGGKVALVFQGKETSYQELDIMISKFASSLKDMGYQQGDHVALVVGNTPHFVIGLYGALRLGLTVIPINPLYTPDELTYILKNGDAKGVITLDVLLPKFEAISQGLPDIMAYIVAETTPDAKWDGMSISPKLKPFSQVVQEGSATNDFPQLKDDDTAVILYTSGTTGKPKGAMLTQQNLYSNAQDVADYLDITNKDRVIATLPMFHVFCLTVAFNAPLMNGGTVIIVPKFSPEEIFKLAKEENPTVFAGVPTMYNYLLQYPNGKKEDLEGLRLCISGGAPMPVALLENFEKKFEVKVSEGYGLSEASPVTCFNPLDRPRKAGSIGTSIIHVENKVVDELGDEVPVEEVGELIVRGPNVMKGYYKLPEDTASALRDGWLYTGDLAKKDEDGYFYIVDRKKDMILIGGYNVYPREVEEVLYQHEDVVEVAVIGAPDPNTGECIKAYVVKKNPELTEQDLHDYCKERLAKYKLPSSIEFLDELPKNTTGKILRRSLRDSVTQ
ncbi:fatty acid--CoA ligase family protein [Bacillaceae bacterium S4-13-56]